jgi:hypothetical protein
LPSIKATSAGCWRARRARSASGPQPHRERRGLFAAVKVLAARPAASQRARGACGRPRPSCQAGGQWAHPPCCLIPSRDAACLTESSGPALVRPGPSASQSPTRHFGRGSTCPTGRAIDLVAPIYVAEIRAKHRQNRCRAGSRPRGCGAGGGLTCLLSSTMFLPLEGKRIRNAAAPRLQAGSRLAALVDAGILDSGAAAESHRA